MRISCETEGVRNIGSRHCHRNGTLFRNTWASDGHIAALVTRSNSRGERLFHSRSLSQDLHFQDPPLWLYHWPFICCSSCPWPVYFLGLHFKMSKDEPIVWPHAISTGSHWAALWSQAAGSPVHSCLRFSFPSWPSPESHTIGLQWTQLVVLKSWKKMACLLGTLVLPEGNTWACSLSSSSAGWNSDVSSIHEGGSAYKLFSF